MTQAEWARRVAAIGEMAGWSRYDVRGVLVAGPSFDGLAILAAMAREPGREPCPAVIAAIRQLAADWLASEGVVASRWRTGIPGKAGQHWCERHDHTPGMMRFAGGQWWAVTGGDLEPLELAPLRWQELDGMDYEVTP